MGQSAGEMMRQAPAKFDGKKKSPGSLPGFWLDAVGFAPGRYAANEALATSLARAAAACTAFSAASGPNAVPST